MPGDPVEILLEAERSGNLYYLGRRAGYIRNGQILKIFGEDDVLSLTDIAQRMHEHFSERYWSLGFNAKRAGELMFFGMTHGIIEPPIFAGQSESRRLVDRGMHFMCVGSAGHQRAICILGQHKDPDADRLVKRELRRRERARVKQLAANRVFIERMLGKIGRDDPDMGIPDELAHLAVPGVTRVVELRQILLDEVEPHPELIDVVWRAHVVASNRKLLRPEPAPIPDEDLAAFEMLEF